jgi:hypothetical protein
MFNSPGNSRVYDLPRRVPVWVKGKIYSKNLRDREMTKQVIPHFTTD